MNALDTTLPAAPRAKAATHPTHKFRLLLRREFWEHKGGFLWAPLIAGGISLLLTLMAIIVGLVAVNRAAGSGELEIDGINVNGLDLGMLTTRLDADAMRELGQGLDLTLAMSAWWPFVVFAFVAFFYCLGALYDDRKDRSVLFWKSLPLSDAETVLSKVVSVAVVAPLLAGLAAIATMFGFLVMISVVVLAYGGDPLTLLWGPARPLTLAAGMLTWIPVFVLWALPTIGWLMLCSAWARSKPFLWAVMIPLFAGIVVGWFDLMQAFELGTSWFWTHVVARLLFGTLPAMDMFYRDDIFGQPQDIETLAASVTPAAQLGSLAMPELWIGAVAGAVMIYGAIRLRRWRDEG